MMGVESSKSPILRMLAVATCLASSSAFAQVNPFTAPTSAMDTLNDAPVAGGNVALERAQAVAAPQPPPGGAPAFGAPPAGAPAPGAAPGAPPPGGAPPAPGQPAPGEAFGQASTAVAKVVKPRVRAVLGERVFDAITGEMLDDAQLIMVDPAEIEALGLVDDGTKGDLVAEDGQYAAVNTSRAYVGQSNQRLKERLIKAIITAEQLTPLEFYGYHILTTERHTPAPRNRRWAMVDDPNGRGRLLAEVDTDKPLQIPAYRDIQNRKDEKIAGKDGWAIRYLDEYRPKKGEIRSEFYPVHIPMPPVPPSIPPPGESSNWKPFGKPEGQAAAAPGGDAFSKYGYKVKAQDLPEGAPTSEPYFNSRMTNRAFGVDTSRK